MKPCGFRTFSVLLTAVFLATYLTLWNYSEQKPPAHVFKVGIPKPFKPEYTNEELREYVKSGNFYPFEEFERRGLPIPNDDSFLQVTLEKDGRTRINRSFVGSLENTAPLTRELRAIFEYRARIGIVEEKTRRVVKAVRLCVPRTAKYGDAVKILDALKTSGADPVVLQIDDLPE